MADLRRLRAAVLITVLCGVFWGLAGAVGRLGYEIIAHGLGFAPGVWSAVGRAFLLGGALGLVGGAIYSAGLVLFGQRSKGNALSNKWAALLGGVAGVGAIFAIRAVGLPTPGGVSPLWFTLGSAAVFGLLGGAMAVAMLGSAKGSDPRLEEKRSKSLPRGSR